MAAPLFDTREGDPDEYDDADAHLGTIRRDDE
jgi:hypothetical protein